MRKCKIYFIRGTDGLLGGTVNLDGRKLSVDVTPGCETFMASVMKNSHSINGERVSATQDPKAWFLSLPTFYRGWSVWTEMGEES